MRTCWSVKGVGITLGAFVPELTGKVAKVETGIDEARGRIIYQENCLIIGYISLMNFGKTASMTVMLVERHMGVSLHEKSSGLNISGGVYTLSNDRTSFNPNLLRAVVKSMNPSQYDDKRDWLHSNSISIDIVNL